jgi:predicted DNA-binding transcriptional regulator AlpA
VKNSSGKRGARTVNEQPNTLTPKKAASYLGISEAALRLWRSEGRGPRFFRAGEKLIRYRRADLDFWIEARLSQPTGAKGDTNEKGQ